MPSSSAPAERRSDRSAVRSKISRRSISARSSSVTRSHGPASSRQTAEEVARRYKISRADQDAFAAESQQRAERALKDGSFQPEIVPVAVPQKKGEAVRVDRDEYPRAGTTAEKLGALKPAFTKEGSV